MGQVILSMLIARSYFPLLPWPALAGLTRQAALSDPLISLPYFSHCSLWIIFPKHLTFCRKPTPHTFEQTKPLSRRWRMLWCRVHAKSSIKATAEQSFSTPQSSHSSRASPSKQSQPQCLRRLWWQKSSAATLMIRIRAQTLHCPSGVTDSNQRFLVASQHHKTNLTRIPRNLPPPKTGTTCLNCSESLPKRARHCRHPLATFPV